MTDPDPRPLVSGSEDGEDGELDDEDDTSAASSAVFNSAAVPEVPVCDVLDREDDTLLIDLDREAGGVGADAFPVDTEGRRVGLLVPGLEAQRALIESTFSVPRRRVLRTGGLCLLVSLFVLFCTLSFLFRLFVWLVNFGGSKPLIRCCSGKTEICGITAGLLLPFCVQTWSSKRP